MKKLNIVLSVLMTLFLSVSLVPPVTVYASPQDDVQAVLANLAKSKETKEVLVKIINNTNRYINLTLDHRSEFHVYNLSIRPGMNQYWLYSGPYKYVYDVTESCGKTVYGHTTFKPGSKLRIGCPGRDHHDP
jgi:hypothetical protein